jgi:hypothetical protein
MRDTKEVIRHYPMVRHRSATPAGVPGNGEVRSLGDNVTSILGSVVNARADTATASITAVGGQQSGARSTPGEVRIKAVSQDKPNAAVPQPRRTEARTPNDPRSTITDVFLVAVTRS